MDVSEMLFWAGLAVSAITGVVSWVGTGETKKGVVAFPFTLLFAAVVAKYIGL
jgi:hypothetical protein